MKNNQNVFRIFLFLVLVLSISCSKSGKGKSDQGLFEHFVVRPMPSSVKNLIVNHTSATYDERCNFYFEIDPIDFKDIIRAKKYVVLDSLNFDIPKVLSEIPRTEQEIYSCKTSTTIYRFITNKRHDTIYFEYIKY